MTAATAPVLAGWTEREARGGGGKPLVAASEANQTGRQVQAVPGRDLQQTAVAHP